MLIIICSIVMISLNEFGSYSRHSERKRFLHNVVKPIGTTLSCEIQSLSNDLQYAWKRKNFRKISILFSLAKFEQINTL